MMNDYRVLQEEHHIISLDPPVKKNASSSSKHFHSVLINTAE